MSHVDRLIQALAEVFTEGEAEMDDAFIERMITALDPITADDFVTLMTGPDDTFTGTWHGRDGLREGWADWLGTFGSVRFEFEGMEQIGDNVLTLGRQIGTTRHGGVVLEQPSAALWKFRDGRIVQIEFHLDRDRAYESAREPA